MLTVHKVRVLQKSSLNERFWPSKVNKKQIILAVGMHTIDNRYTGESWLFGRRFCSVKTIQKLISFQVVLFRQIFQYFLRSRYAYCDGYQKSTDYAQKARNFLKQNMYTIYIQSTVVCKIVHKIASVWCKSALGEVGVSLP